MDNRPIGVCDSGIGGIVVLSEIIKKLPHESFIYLGDTGRFPYGSKSQENIIKYTKESIAFLIKQNVKAIVVACGTASTVLSEVLKYKYPVPIIGIIEPTMNAITGPNVAVIATARTIASKVWDQILLEHNPNLKIASNGCPLLAPMAEAGWTDNEIAKLAIREYLKPFQNKKINQLILGCTHYPLFKSLIKQELKNTEIIDVGEHTAIYLQTMLKKKKLLSEKAIPKYQINLTDMDESYLSMVNSLLNGLAEIERSNIKKVEL